MKLMIAAVFALSLCPVARAADAPKPVDNSKRCAELQAKYDKHIKGIIFLRFEAQHAYNEMKQLNCPNLPADPKTLKK